MYLASIDRFGTLIFAAGKTRTKAIDTLKKEYLNRCNIYKIDPEINWFYNDLGICYIVDGTVFDI